MTKVRRYGVSMVAAGLLFGLVGCSDSDGSATEDPTSEASASADTTDPASTDPASTDPASTDPAATETTTAATPDPAVPVLTKDDFASELAAAQTDAGSAHIEATIEASGQVVEMSGDVANFGELDSLAMSMSLNTAGQQLQMVLVDKVLYIRGPGIGTDPAKPWLKLDISDPNNPFSQLFDASNPANFTAYLEGVTRFKDKGIETVDGVETRHYAVTVDTAKMMAANPAFKGQDVASLGLPDHLTSQVYVDSDNLPRKMSVSLGSAASFEANFSKYGEQVDIEAPPAGQVSEFSR